MSTIAGLLGTGAGVVVLAVGWLVLRHHRRFPGMTHPWLRRAALVLFFAGGSALTVTALGGWVLSAIAWVGGIFGGFSAGIPYAVVTVAVLVLLTGEAIDFVFEPANASPVIAGVLPLLMAIPAAGFLHSLSIAMNGPAASMAVALSRLIGG